jgi:hypothetical protein
MTFWANQLVSDITRLSGVHHLRLAPLALGDVVELLEVHPLPAQFDDLS